MNQERIHRRGGPIPGEHLAWREQPLLGGRSQAPLPVRGFIVILCVFVLGFVIGVLI